MATRFAGEQQLNIPGMETLLAAAPTRAAAGVGFRTGLRNALRPIARRAVPIAGVGTILALLDAAGELNDPNDPIGRNVAEAGGQVGGNILGALLGGGLGFALGGPGGAVIGSGLGGAALGGPGKGIGAGLYDAATGNTPGERERRKIIADARTNMLVNAEAMDLKAAQQRQAAELAVQLQNEYNYANAMNQQAINQQAASALQDLARQQYLYS